MAANNTPSVTDFSQYAGLRAAAKNNDPAALKKAAQQFEALFTQMLLKSARATSFGDDLTGEQGGMVQDMFDQQMSLTLAQGKGLGLADMLVKQMQAQMPAPTPAAGATAAPAAADSKGVDTTATGSGAKSPVEFVKQLLPHAKAAAEKLGVSARVLIAQAALETGWGQHPIKTGDGAPSFNLFGVKAAGSWNGASATARTTEVESGMAKVESAAFRAYDSLASGFKDFVGLLSGHARYGAALNTGDDAHKYAQALQNAGYATDPLYAQKVAQVAASPQLAAALAQAS